MHHTQALKTLLQCLEDLTGTVETFGQEQNIHEIEKDLILYRGRLLYEAMLKLPTAEAKEPEGLEEVTLSTPVMEEEATIQLEEPRVVLQEITTPIEETIEAEPEILAQEELEIEIKAVDTREMSDNEAEVVIDQLTITLEKEDVNNENQSRTDTGIKSMRLERFSIAQVLHQSWDKDLILTHLKLKPIQDLKSGIGLNEKFLFIRELFENDHQAYAQAVDALNSRESIEEAESYIADELLPRYGWELEKEALLNFLHLVLRRFSNT